MPRAQLAFKFTPQRFGLSLFEKVILVNSLLIFGGAMVALWITSQSLEAHHYFIDTTFIVAVALISLLVNILLMRISFRPLFSLLQTIRAVSTGQTDARANISPSDSEISELASAFNAMLDKLQTLRQEQAMLILQAQEQERQRIALELHDQSSQELTALLVHIEILGQSLQALADGTLLRDVREQLSRGFASLTTLAQKTLENIRVLALQLRPSVLDDLGLNAAFRWLAEDACQRLKLAVSVQIEGELASSTRHASMLPATVETVLFRIAQESLTNVARHAQAQHVNILLRQDFQQIHLRICDDGKGYDPGQSSTGLGIVGMRERAAALGGTLTITSTLGHGTTVEAILPHLKDPAHV